MLPILRSFYQQISQRTYLLIWISIGLLGLVTLYVRINVIFLANPDVGGIESNVVYSVLRIIAGYPLYQNPEEAPYAITQYSPIYYYLTAGFSRLMGFTADDVYEVYATSRCLSLVANGFYVWGISQVARQQHLPTRVAVLVGILVFTLLPPQSYGRPDSLSNALAIWTIWAVLRWNISEAKPLRYGAALTAFLVATALFSKQSAICLLIIVVGYLLLFGGNFRQISSFLGWLIVFLVGLYGCLFRQETTLVYANVVRGVSNGIDLANFGYNIVDHYLRPFVWLVVPALAISIRYILFEQGPRQFIGFATVGFFMFALATGLKAGAALNYFTEFTGLSCVLLADSLWQLRNTQSDWATVGRLGIVLGTVWVIPVNAINFNWERTLARSIDLTAYRQEQAVAQYVKNKLNECPGCLVYNTVSNGSYLNAFLFRNCAAPQQEIIAESAYPRRTFNYVDLDQAAQDGRIRFVTARDGDTKIPLDPPVHLANYRPIKSLAGYTIYQFESPAGR